MTGRLPLIYCHVDNSEAGNDAPPFLLSERQIEILSLSANGLSSSEIGAKLGISAQTVRHHGSAIFDKLGVPNMKAAILVAFRNHII